MITHVRDDSGALDWLLLLLNKAGESTHVNEVTELLAHSSVKDGNLARARDLYQMLATTEPQNQLHMQNYSRWWGAWREHRPSTGITAEEGAVIVEELEATAPVIDQFYPDHVRSRCVPRSPMRTCSFPTICRTRRCATAGGSAAGAARCAPEPAPGGAAYPLPAFYGSRGLLPHPGSVYHDAGYPDEAVRYGELAARYEQNAEAALRRGRLIAAMRLRRFIGLAPSQLSLRTGDPPAALPALADGRARGSDHEIAPARASGIRRPGIGRRALPISDGHDDDPPTFPSGSIRFLSTSQLRPRNSRTPS
jgi:hypothetical protein